MDFLSPDIGGSSSPGCWASLRWPSSWSQAVRAVEQSVPNQAQHLAEATSALFGTQRLSARPGRRALSSVLLTPFTADIGAP
jgi:hypothetical protein